ncbi:hypothetical protein B9G55_05110 [Saccharibacillus sp. O16]|nr:hypothetical protein B9G55_05110 [Saccharibacillus sp. O16]
MTSENKSTQREATAQNLAQRLKQEAPKSIHQLRPGVSFESIWEGEIKEMRPVKVSKSTSQMRRVIAAAVVLVLATAAILGARLLESSKPMPAAPDVSGIHFRELDDIYASGKPRQVIDEQLDKLSTPLNIVVEDQGITLTLVKAYYDGGQLMIDYVVDDQSGGPELNPDNASFNYELKIPEKVDTQAQGSRRSKTFLTPHRFAGTIVQRFDAYDRPTNLQVNLKVSRLATKNGKWEANIDLSSAKIDQLTSTFYPGTTFTYKGSEFNVTEVSAGPTYSLIRMDQKLSGDISAQGIMYYDDQDTRFSTQWMTGDGSEKGVVKWSETVDPFKSINPKPSSLRLRIFDSQIMSDANTGTATQPFDGKTPVTLKGFDGQTMTLTNIDFQKDRTVVQLKYSDRDVQNWFPYFNSSNKEDGYSAYYPPQRISQDELLFEAIFPPMNPDELTEFAATTSKESEAQSVDIPLDWNTAVKGRPAAKPSVSK